MKSALVLGAGIQGVCAALALRQRGYQVILVDRMSDVMLRTSLYNEGKIHLGFVYANDSTFQTAALLLGAALRFSPLLEAWLEMKVAWREMVSTPFLYAIARDSMLAPHRLVAHYTRVQATFEEMAGAGEGANYLRRDLRGKNLWRRAPRAGYMVRFATRCRKRRNGRTGTEQQTLSRIGECAPPRISRDYAAFWNTG